MENIYNLSEKKRIVVLDKRVELQVYRAGYNYPSGSFCGFSWYVESTLTKEEFEKLKNLLIE